MSEKLDLSIAFQTDKKAREYIALAQYVDQFAFDVVSVYCDAPFHPAYMPLALMAPHIKRARLGVAAVSPSRIHPIDIAAQAALLDDIATRGTYIGLARGAWLESHGIYETGKPLQAIRETVDIIRYLHQGTTGGYAGEQFTIAAHVSAPYPIPEHDIPILIGTWGKKLAALAGEIAAEVKVGGSANPDFVPVMRDYLAVGEIKANRTVGDVGIVMGAVCVIDEDRTQAILLAKREVALYLPVVAKLDHTLTIEPELIARIERAQQQSNLDEAVGLISDELMEKFAFAGNAEDIIRQTEALADAGATRVEYGTPHGIRARMGIQLLGERVLPAFGKI